MSLADCIFCKIIDGKIPSKKLGETEHAIAIADISPQADFHALILPKRHVASLNDLNDEDRKTIVPKLYELADDLARSLHFREAGYRTVINNQADSGQTVFHLHMHVLGRSKLRGSFGA